MLQLKRVLIVVHDLLVTAAAVVLSIVLRFDDDLSVLKLEKIRWWIIVFVFYAGCVYFLFGLYKAKWRFASLPDSVSITQAVAVLSITALAIDYVLIRTQANNGYFLGLKTILIYSMLQVILLIMPRMAYRYWKDRGQQLAFSTVPSAPSIIVGRSYDVEPALRVIQTGIVRGINPVAILSPRRADYGQSIRGVPVVGRPGAMADAVADLRRHNVEVRRLIVLPSALNLEDEAEMLLHNARKIGLTPTYMKTFEDAAPRITPISIPELLVRPSFNIDDKVLSNAFQGKRVAVTGAGGSIGGELCRKLARFGVSQLLMLDHSEPALHEIGEQLAMDYPGIKTQAHICDVRDPNRLSDILNEYRPEVVFHGAAIKHVPYLERDWSEGIRTNIIGSINVAQASVEAGAKMFVMISTDKAIDPTSLLGATKRFAEIYTEALDVKLRESGNPMRLISVRFGNVLGSNGSVVPKFLAQIERGGPLTVTHPDMIRYFMTIGEAVNLVLTAADHASKPDGMSRASTYVLKMGKPIRILDLAERLARMSGFEPGIDIEIVYTGARPGERLKETLFAKDERTVELGTEGIMAAQTNTQSLERIGDWVARLQQAIDRNDRAMAVRILQEAIPTYDADGAIWGEIPAAYEAGER